jgi:hypothetical protein
MRCKVIITDVTDYNDLHCVAGWDRNAKRMVRPEPAKQSFWAKKYVGPGQLFWPGHVVEFEGDPAGPPYPHATEDVVVKIETLKKVGTAEVPSEVIGSVAESLQALFSHKLVLGLKSAHVPLDVECSSLGAIVVDRKRVTLIERKNEKGQRKLRAYLRDAADGKTLDLSVTSTVHREALLRKGFTAAEDLLPKAGDVHLRIGLARPWPNFPKHCFVQINGLFAV